jgi:hypothetical protein
MEYLARAIRQEKEIHGIQIWKEEIKLCLLMDDMILYLTDLKNSTNKLLDMIKTFRKVVGFKTNKQKSVAFLYINNEQPEKEIRKTIPFTIASKKLKYLGVNLMKKVTDLYNENYKSQKKEIHEDVRKWRRPMLMDWQNQYCENV